MDKQILEMNIAVRSQGLVLKDLLKGILLKKRHFYVFILPYMFSDFFCRCFFTKKTFLCFHFPRMFPSGKQICQQLVVLNKSAFAERNFKQSSFKIICSWILSYDTFDHTVQFQNNIFVIMIWDTSAYPIFKGSSVHRIL